MLMTVTIARGVVMGEIESFVVGHGAPGGLGQHTMRTWFL